MIVAMSRRLHLRYAQLALVIGVALNLAFATAGLLIPAIAAFAVALTGLVGLFFGYVKVAAERQRRFQFSLATLLWLMFLLPACYFITDFSFNRHLPEFIVLVVASFILKQMLAGGAARRSAMKNGAAAQGNVKQEVHPLDE